MTMAVQPLDVVAAFLSKGGAGQQMFREFCQTLDIDGYKQLHESVIQITRSPNSGKSKTAEKIRIMCWAVFRFFAQVRDLHTGTSQPSKLPLKTRLDAFQQHVDKLNMFVCNILEVRPVPNASKRFWKLVNRSANTSPIKACNRPILRKILRRRSMQTIHFGKAMQ